MVFKKEPLTRLDLQLFADGGDGGTGASATGVTGADAAPQESNPQPTSAAPTESTESPEDLTAEFEELIKGKFKSVYGAKVQSVVQQRLKGQAEKDERLSAYDSLAQQLALRYSIEDASDLEAISKALDEDDDWLEDEALDKGVPVDVLKQLKSLEAFQNNTRAAQREAEKQAQFEQVMRGIESGFEAVKAKYPGADLRTEMENESFAGMVFAGFDPMNAFEALHHDEIVNNAVQQASAVATQQVTATVRSGANRPVENGVAVTQSNVEAHQDPSKMSRKEVLDIMQRAMRGEIIKF